ncbi:MAG: dihydroxyacetone kinase subunit DhaK [Oscillospiraceae bacterium]|jgi:glycerone kinase subunit K
MKKFINDPFDFVEELTEGIIKAHGDYYRADKGDLRIIVRQDAPIKGKVAIATGGGSGHLPVFMGYVGKGLADGACIGNVFSSPSAGQMKRVTKAIDGGAGVLYLYGRYQGDMMNFNSAAEESIKNGIRVESVIVSDDVASAPPERHSERRGVAGIFFAYKIAGAMANEMASLDEVKRVTQKAVDNTRSLGIALGPCTIPLVGKPNFEISDDEMEIGMGIHGEQGVERVKMRTADEIAATLVDRVVNDMPFVAGDEVAVLVNSLGATPLEELYVLYRKIDELLREKGLVLHRPYVGRYACSMEMQGMSLSLMKLDDELKRLLDAPADSPFFKQF